MEVLSKKHQGVKFLKMTATKCIEKLTDANCPSVLIYRNGAVFKQLIPLKMFISPAKLTVQGTQGLHELK